MNPSEPTIIWQNPRQADSHLYKVIQGHLSAPDIKGFRAAVAYVSWGGLSLIAEALEGFLKQGKTAETLFGIENGVTTPDALLYSLYLKKRYASYAWANALSWNYIDSEWHSKYYEFVYPHHSVCIVGSGNLTGGGMACNHELAASFSLMPKSRAYGQLRKWWEHCAKEGEAITPATIREANRLGQLGRERRPREGATSASRLGLRLPRAKKPLFQHILEETEHGVIGHEMLADADSLSEKPRRLYLQILQNETGGGHQIQLPVATLGAYFGVGTGEIKGVEFRFPESQQSVAVKLTHFDNNTHRVRLLPLKGIPRPAIVIFSRTSDTDKYECVVVPQKRYEAYLSQKCQERTRRDSRKWGLGD